MTAAEVFTPVDGAELMARIKPQKRRDHTYLCLRPDLIDRWNELNGELNDLRAKDAQAGRLASGVSQAVKKKAQEVQAIEQEIEATQVRFDVESMSKDEWKALCAVHPPRKDNIVDQSVGYDRDAVYDEAVRLCLISPIFTDAAWDELTGVISPTEWDELRETVQRVNGKVVQAPKSALAASLLRGTNGTTSRPRKSGG